MFDGSAVKMQGEGIPGRSIGIFVFFVLSRQPLGRITSRWDLGLDGMCVGERGCLIIPPVLVCVL